MWRFFRKKPAPDPLAPLQAELQDLKKQLRRQNLLMEGLKTEVAKAVQDQRRPLAEVFCSLADALFYHIQALAANQNLNSAHLETAEIIWERLDTALAQLELTMIRACGVPFDARIHEAVANQAASGSDFIVAHVVQPGYQLGSQLLRPAKVVVDAFESAAEE